MGCVVLLGLPVSAFHWSLDACPPWLRALSAVRVHAVGSAEGVAFTVSRVVRPPFPLAALAPSSLATRYALGSADSTQRSSSVGHMPR